MHGCRCPYCQQLFIFDLAEKWLLILCLAICQSFSVLRLGREVIRIVVVRYIDIVSHSCLRLGIEVVRINVVGYIVGHIALHLFTYQCRLFSYIK